jgi:formate hydrogenlyase subunit 6/NADH:ubiquinone oxidoreductase subunit I
VTTVPKIGLFKGLGVTLKTLMTPATTQQYPHVKPDLPPRTRGVIALMDENCTVCMLCARECPDWCIYIDSRKETVPTDKPGRTRTRNVLDRFAIDFALCMYCGICVEVCPFDALFWSPEFEYSEYSISELLHEQDRLREWMDTVPPPPPLEEGAEPPMEVAKALQAVEAEREKAVEETLREEDRAAFTHIKSELSKISSDFSDEIRTVHRRISSVEQRGHTERDERHSLELYIRDHYMPREHVEKLIEESIKRVELMVKTVLQEVQKSST